MSELMLINPRKRRAVKSAPKRRRRNPVAALAANPVRRRRARPATMARKAIRRRRNPIAGGFSVTSMLMDGAKGAAGALAVGYIYDKLPLPLTLKTGNTPHIVRAAIAVVLAMAGRKIMGRTAVSMAQGALAVSLAGLLNSATGLKVPGLNGYSDDLPQGGVFDGMGVYSGPNLLPASDSLSPLEDTFSGMGEYTDSMAEYVPTY